MSARNNTIVFVLGPTSSGKSQVAVGLAEKIDGEVISCDSMQVYQDMDIINRAPKEDLTRRIKHHLVRIIPPENEFSAADFCREAGRTIKEVMQIGKIPIIAGGTGFYVKALVDGIFESPEKNKIIRDKYEDIAKSKGTAFLYDELKRVDPVASQKIHANDLKRIVRALEVYEVTGITISENKKNTKGISGEYNCQMFGLAIPREKLYMRINASVDEMFNAGLVEEVRELDKRKLSITAEKAIGIKEARAFLSKEKSFEEMAYDIKKNTRNYAKRQHLVHQELS